MNELDYILEVHRRERMRAELVADAAMVIIMALVYGIYRLIEWIT